MPATRRLVSAVEQREKMAPQRGPPRRGKPLHISIRWLTLRCKDRDCIRGHGFVHSDKNAAVNIMSIYAALADEEKKERPLQFLPKRGSRYS